MQIILGLHLLCLEGVAARVKLTVCSWAGPDQPQAGGPVSSLYKSGFGLLCYVIQPDSSYEYYYFKVGVNQFDHIIAR